MVHRRLKKYAPRFPSLFLKVVPICTSEVPPDTIISLELGGPQPFPIRIPLAHHTASELKPLEAAHEQLEVGLKEQRL
jgi:hypothetical protein